MKLNNLMKSTLELDPHLILKGEQEQVFHISAITISIDDLEILLSLSDKPSGITLKELQSIARTASPGSKLFLFHPLTKTKTPIFGYYLRNQALILK